MAGVPNSLTPLCDSAMSFLSFSRNRVRAALGSCRRSRLVQGLLLGVLALNLTSCDLLASLLIAVSDPSPSQHLLFGNPSDATTDPRMADNYLLTGRDYALSYNKTRGTANWVSWKLSKATLGAAERQDDFRADDRLPQTGIAWMAMIIVVVVTIAATSFHRRIVRRMLRAIPAHF